MRSIRGIPNTPPVVVSYDSAAELWTLERDYRYSSNPHRISIPKGFRFDLASVPRAVWWAIGPFELSIEAALCHDFLYRYGGKPPSYCSIRTYTRKQADELFLRIMKEEGISWWRRRIAYRAVRWFGGSSWRADG